MENNNSKVISVSFMVAGILAGVVVSVLMETLAAIATGGFGRFVSQDIIRHGLPVVAGLAVFLGLQLNASVKTWADEVVTEIRRVVWPSQKDTTAMTIMVCVMVLISGVVLGLMDVVSGSLVDWLVHQNFGGLI